MEANYRVSTFVGPQATGTTHSVFMHEGLAVAPALQSLSQRLDDTVVLMETCRLNDRAPRVRFFAHGHEVLRCGSGTLAAGWVLSEACGFDGDLRITTSTETVRIFKDVEGYGYGSQPLPQEALPEPSRWEAIVRTPVVDGALCGGDHDYLIAELASEQAVINARPNEDMLVEASRRALILTARTAPGYVLRYFAPQYGLREAGATGSANIQLLRYWYRRGQRGRLVARQCSISGGEFWGLPGPEAVRLYGRVSAH